MESKKELTDRELLEKIAVSSRETADAVKWIKGFFVFSIVIYCLYLGVTFLDWLSRNRYL